MEAAVQYAKRGFRVFPVHGIRECGELMGECNCQQFRDLKNMGPCRSPGKHPRNSKWQKIAFSGSLALTEEQQRLFKKPNTNIGIATGPESGVVVVDVDPRHGGDDSLATLIKRYGPLPATLTVATGGGGSHSYFAYPEGITVRNMASFRPGLDVRGKGGYVIAPPSVHESGKSYTWDGIEGAATPVAPAPNWLLDLFLSKDKKSSNKKSDDGGTIPEGQRNTRLTSLAGAARRKGSTEAEIEALLLAANKARCRPPLDEDEVRAIVKSVCNYPPGDGNTDAEEAVPSWRDHLIVSAKGFPLSNLANVITALRLAPEWKDVLAFNAFSLKVGAQKPPPWEDAQVGEWSDREDVLAAAWMQHHDINAGVNTVGLAVQTVARDRSFHPVRDYLNSLGWDGTSRTSSWLTTYLGATETAYTKAIGPRFLIAAVSRIFQPGAKVDTCLVLEGPQGLLKSTAVRKLTEPWFTDQLDDLSNKDAAMQCAGVWMIEIAELDSLARADAGRIKAFMSRAVDRFRPPYAKHVIAAPRQCVFVGTCSHADYLKDETGGRRFWPVVCGAQIKLDELARDRDQLWAEAVHLYKAGTKWWIDGTESELNTLASGEQASRYEGDPWDQLIGRFISEMDSVTVEDILVYCILKDRAHWTQQDKTRIARSLRFHGWSRTRDAQPDEGGKRGYHYWPPKPKTPGAGDVPA
jgi:predicted P-loop ATPase